MKAFGGRRLAQEDRRKQDRIEDAPATGRITARRRVLVVDDEANVRLSLLAMLEPMGVEAEAVGRGRDALARIEEEAFDLILLDLKMPGMSGMEVLRELTARAPDVPVIIVTAHGDVETAVEAIQTGAANFIEKPFSLGQIRTLVAQTLDADTRDRDMQTSYERHIDRAKAAIVERRLDAALEHARRAVSLRPASAASFNLLGVVMQLRMEISEAQRYFRSALALDGAYEPARQNLDNVSSFPKKLSEFHIE